MCIWEGFDANGDDIAIEGLSFEELCHPLSKFTIPWYMII